MLKFDGGFENSYKPSVKQIKCMKKFRLDEKKNEAETSDSGTNFEPLDKLRTHTNEKQLQQLMVCFGRAYFIANMELSFTMYPHVMELQNLHGVSMSNNYRTDNSCRR